MNLSYTAVNLRKNIVNNNSNNILSLIAFIISHRLFADELNIQQSLLDRATVVLIIILVDKTQLSLILGDIAAYTLLARFIPITKIRDPLLKKNAAKSRILLACADGRTRQCYLTICAILRCLNKGHDNFIHLVNCFGWKHHNFNIHVSLATDTLYLLLKGLLVAIISLLFVLKAPFALHFIRAVCNLVTLAQYKSYDEDTLAYIQGALERINVFKEEFRVYQRTLGEEKNFNYPKALDSICTRANSEAHHITIVKQFYSMTNKKETALLAANYATVVKQSRPSTTVNIQDRTYSTRVTRSLPFCRLRWLILGIQPYSTKLLLSEVAANIAISNFTHAAAVFQSSSKRHNDPKHCDEEVHRDYVWVQEFEHRDNRRQSRTVTDDRKHMAYIRAFSEVLLFNNNRQIDNTTRMLTFKFYDLSTIIRSVHLVPRDLPNLTTRTTMSYYVNNYIDWDEYNCLYSPTFNINLLRTLREY
ncbi:hypothetical protein HBI44_224430 [Parastagonospora nodorum]|nr:hypothetical protein HBI44_224430 [Parastagonospora nodorum]